MGGTGGRGGKGQKRHFTVTCKSISETSESLITIVVYVVYIFAVGDKDRCDEFAVELNKMVPVKNLGDLRWYSGLHYERDIERGTIKISQQTYAEELAKEYGGEKGKSIPMSASVKLEELSEGSRDNESFV